MFENEWKEAYSLGANNRPDSISEIDEKKENGNTYTLYKGDDGAYYYKSSMTEQFDREMKEVEKRNRLNRRVTRRYLQNHEKK